MPLSIAKDHCMLEPAIENPLMQTIALELAEQQD